MEQTPQYFDESYDAIAKQCLADCKQTEDFLGRAKDCGCQTDNEDGRNAQQMAFLQAFRKNYFPHNP